MSSLAALPEFDDEFRFVTKNEPRMERWREAAAAFYRSKQCNASYRTVLTYFLTRYLPDTQHPFDPQSFMMKEHCPPNFYEHRGLTSRDACVDNNRIHAFLNFYRRQRLFRHVPEDGVITSNKYRNHVLMRSVDTGVIVISQYRDAQFLHVTDLDPSLEDWRVAAASWPKAKTLKYARLAIDGFLLDYIGQFDLERNPQAFLRLTTEPPDYWGHICPDAVFNQATVRRNNAIHHFLAWTATEYYGTPDAYGVKHAPPDLLNPVPHRNFTTGVPNYSDPDNNPRWANRADKDYRYLLDLDPALEEWRSFAARWTAMQGDTHHRRTALNAFFKDFIVAHQLPRNPRKFFDPNENIPDLWSTFGHESAATRDKHNIIHSFCNWVVKELSRESKSPQGLENPISRKVAHFGPGKSQSRSRPLWDQPHNWGSAKDGEFLYLLGLDPSLEPWRREIVRYFSLLNGGKSLRGRVRSALNIFARDYIVACSLPRDPIAFFENHNSMPDFWTVLSRETRSGRDTNNLIHHFLEDVLERIQINRPAGSLDLVNPVYLRNKSRERRAPPKSLESTSDIDLQHLVKVDPNLLAWQEAAQEWLVSPKMISGRTLGPLRAALNTFLLDYISGLDLEREPREFLTRNLHRTTFREFLNSTSEHAIKVNNYIHRFCEWLVTDKYAVHSEDGVKRLPRQLYNPVPLIGRNGGKPRFNKGRDTQFFWVEHLDRNLEEWRVLAAAWYAQYDGGRTEAISSIGKFLELYIFGLDLTRDPNEFLMRSYRPSETFEECLARLGYRTDAVHSSVRSVYRFLEWLIEEHVKVENDDGAPILPHEFHNPVTLVSHKRSSASESYRETLPYEWIRSLLAMLTEGPNFRDLEWAQSAVGRSGHGGDWFKVPKELIDEDDPDCVYRKRKVWESGKQVERYYLWSPARTVALILKLSLPLRTVQVRLLESGEGDTWRYEDDGWQLNKGHHAGGTKRNPIRRGVFRRMQDLEANTVTTGFFINTNKTSDSFNDPINHGYVIPWQREDVLYWLAKLRDWQEKYNPVAAPIPWSSLENKHLGRVKPHKTWLAARGESYFLFRDAAAYRVPDRVKPLPGHKVDALWDRLLLRFETEMFERGETLSKGEKILFVDANTGAALFPLHNLRVSLITAYALRGLVPLPILSKLIAGHASIFMTLYYTKVSNAYLSEVMKSAEQRLEESATDDIKQFLHDANERQALERLVFVDQAGVDAAGSMRSPAAFRVMDYGICPRNGAGCHEGGEALVENSNVLTYAPVPGYPDRKNCTRCRFFITGPAFLPALEAYCNALLYETKQGAIRLADLNEAKLALEDRRAAALDANEAFAMTQNEERLMHTYDAAVTTVDGLMHDLVACTALIARCVELVNTPAEDGVKLVLPGGYDSVRWAFEEYAAGTENAHLLAEARQLQLMCENAEKYSIIDARTPTLQRSRVIDSMLLLNRLPPMMITLPEEDLLKAGNHLIALLKARAGSTEGAMEVLTGIRKLADIGIVNEKVLTEGLRQMTGSTVAQLTSESTLTQ